MDRLVLLIGKISGFVPFDPANFPSVLGFFFIVSRSIQLGTNFA